LSGETTDNGQPGGLLMVGCGNMGYALLTGWINAGCLAPRDVVVVEPSDALRARVDALGCRTVSSADALPADIPRYVVLAVKPQIIGRVAADYRRFGGGDTVFISIAAGTTLQQLLLLLSSRTPVIRCVPNTPAAVGDGLVLACANAFVSAAMRAETNALFAANGQVVAIDDETLLDAATAISGSGPAYVYSMIEALAAAGETIGLPQKLARQMSLQTFLGASSLAAKTGEEIATLRAQVVSPNGTTAAALAVMNGDGQLTRLFQDSVTAAFDRAKELASESTEAKA
jgi:pyrroline-5-carboxylate reductase